MPPTSRGHVLVCEIYQSRTHATPGRAVRGSDVIHFSGPCRQIDIQEPWPLIFLSREERYLVREKRRWKHIVTECLVQYRKELPWIWSRNNVEIENRDVPRLASQVSDASYTYFATISILAYRILTLPLCSG